MLGRNTRAGTIVAGAESRQAHRDNSHRLPLPKLGDVIENKKVVELLTDKELLKERSACALNTIEVVAVLAKQV
jgi:hypothetical protein